MKTRFSFLFLFFAFAAITASAQTTASKGAAATEEKKVWVPGKVIPVAEFYPGGKEALYAFIAKQTKYPVMAKRNRMQGECIISFTLNEDGSTSGFKILKNVGGGTGEEALRVAKLIKFKAPGPGLSTLASLPIAFKL
jgi:periplasmic protein TonB